VSFSKLVMLFAPGSWSIALRLVLLFTVAAAILLLATMAASYWIVVQHINRDDDRFLSDKLTAVRDDLAEDQGAQPLSEGLRRSRGGQTVAYWVRVNDARGQIVAETPHMGDLLPARIFPPHPTPQENRPHSIMYRDGAGNAFALVTASATVGGADFTLQLAQDRTLDERFAAHFGILLTAMLGCAILTCAGLSSLITRRGLRPLKRMAESVERVGATHLDERVPAAGWPKEVQPLAIGFNRMLDRLENSFTRLSQFSADLAHELRTPIAILRGEAEGALIKARTSDEYRQVIESSLEEFQRLSRLIDNLLFIARAETIGSLTRSSFDGGSVIEKIREFYEAVSQEQGVEIRCEGEAEVYADRVLFRRALLNLISNALRFTPSGGTISVSLTRRNNGAEISVADTGCGIAPKHLDKVFDRFFRGDAARSSEGTGLGLAIVKSIMQIHDGSVFIASNIGRGTIVTLTFPKPSGARLDARHVKKMGQENRSSRPITSIG
jgi:two-component system, OmpR family, heavy metal sensor histidine kinase CusS